MAGAGDVVAATAALAGDDVTLWALVPNAKGAELATAAGIDHLTITISASAAYSEKNVHMTIDEAKAQVVAIRSAAPGAVLDEVISCCFGSPFDGEEVTPDDVDAIVEHAPRCRRRSGDAGRHHRDGDAAADRVRAGCGRQRRRVCTSTTREARRS